ncbi:MAG: hypothetical protein PF693_20645 [Spirochaetia bacterium]|jgi:hypothetical protein|nr:hypothetical protein [Spirochaetia bacterium]
MRVANPIYDVVFKYLIGDMKIAKLILSSILGTEIEELEFAPTELQTRIKNDHRNFTVFRIDFTARLRYPDGKSELVIIEIQKAKFHTDIMRFRRYLGTQYQNKENVYTDKKGKTKPLPIKTIYFLGTKLEHTDAPIIKVKRKYFDGITNEPIINPETFIESLTHDSYVIQIPSLKEERRNKLEILLSIFDQRQRDQDAHYLNLKEEDFPEEFRPVIRRLLQAGQEKEVYDVMIVEDEILDELAELERSIEEKDKALDDNKKTIDELRKKIKSLEG